MNQAEEFFFELKDWSARKVAIVRKYVGGFSTILGSRYRELYYVDGFAGRGVYEDGEKGSPVQIAELAQEFQDSNKAFNLSCINIERDPNNFANLTTETKRFGNLVTNYDGAFEDHIEKVLLQTKKIPAVFFIDPFGVKGSGWEYVKKIIARKDKTDIWIRFDHLTVRRLSGNYVSGAKDAQGKMQLLQDLYGIKDIEYIHKRLEAGSTADERIRNAVALYEEQIEKAYNGLQRNGFAASYPIASINGQRKYHLVFACSNYKAATLASNIINGAEEVFQHDKEEYEETQTGQPSLFPIEVSDKQKFDDKVKKLRQAILQLPKRKPMSREELLYALISSDKRWFGNVGKRHLTQALKDLSNAPANRVKITDGTPGSDTAIITILE